MKDFKLFLIMLGGIFLFNACEKAEPDCYQPDAVMLYFNFKIKDSVQIDSIQNDSTILDTLIIDYRDTLLTSPALVSLGQVTNFVSYGTNTQYLGALLNPAIGSIRYTLQFDTAVDLYDTITCYYQTEPHFVSNSCGFTHYFFLNSIQVTGNFIDSFSVVLPEITSSASDRHVYLFFFNQ